MKSGGKLSRYNGLQRFARLPQVRKEPRRSSREHDSVYLAKVRTLTCCVARLGMQPHSCMGTVVAHHAGTHGMGQKCADSQTIPLCSLAHSCLHDFRGPFAGWTRSRMREWEDARITETQCALGHSPTTD